MYEASDSTLSTFTASDGDNLAVQDWALPEGLQIRGVVVLVHGLGEHAGRYDHVARRLNRWGFAVRGYDHYGHGESNGVRIFTRPLPSASNRFAHRSRKYVSRANFRPAPSAR